MMTQEGKILYFYGIYYTDDVEYCESRFVIPNPRKYHYCISKYWSAAYCTHKKTVMAVVLEWIYDGHN